MQGNSNQQQQTPLPTNYAAPRERTRQVLGFDETARGWEPARTSLFESAGPDNNARVASDITYYAYALKLRSTPERQQWYPFMANLERRSIMELMSSQQLKEKWIATKSNNKESQFKPAQCAGNIYYRPGLLQI